MAPSSERVHAASSNCRAESWDEVRDAPSHGFLAGPKVGWGCITHHDAWRVWRASALPASCWRRSSRGHSHDRSRRASPASALRCALRSPASRTRGKSSGDLTASCGSPNGRRSGSRASIPSNGERQVAASLAGLASAPGPGGVLGMALHPQLLRNAGRDEVYVAVTYEDGVSAARPWEGDRSLQPVSAPLRKGDPAALRAVDVGARRSGHRYLTGCRPATTTSASASRSRPTAHCT